jgi:hypothetical protein
MNSSIHILSSRPLKACLIMLTLMALACGGGQVGPGPTNPGPTEIPPPSLKDRPDMLARDFLDHLRAQRFRQAHAFLGTSLQAAMTTEVFETRMGEALKTASTRLAYENRWVQSERIEGSRALVTVSDRRYSQVQPWTWEFRLEEGKWKIQTLDLPPILRHVAP